MARFDLYPTRSTRIPYLLDVQSDLLDGLPGRIVMPVIPKHAFEDARMARLNPIVPIAGTLHILLTQEIATVPKEKLSRPVANIEADHRDEIVAALDFLFQGY